MAINYKELVKEFDAQPETAVRNLREAFETRQLKANEFDLGRLFEECHGSHDYYKCKRDPNVSASEVMSRRVTETTGSVNTSHFLNITGQITYASVLEKYMDEDFVFSAKIPTRPASVLDGEKIAGVTRLGDEAVVRREGDPYQLAGVGEDWIFTPPVVDRGFIVPVTWEAIFADRTGQLLERCGEVGTFLGVNKEKRAIDCVIDENTTAHRYNWRGTVIATYGNNSGTHTWDNLEASNALVDWTDIDNADQLFNQMVDPYTGEPIMIDPKHLVVTKSLEKVAMRIRNATEVTVTTPGYATSGNPSRTTAANPVGGKFDVVTSRLLASRLATDTTWFYGDISKAFAYMQAEPLSVVQAPTNNKDEFERRIVAQYRANERGAYVTINPRYMVTCTA